MFSPINRDVKSKKRVLFLDFKSQSTTQGRRGTNVPVHINHKHSYEEKEYFLCNILLFFYFKHYNVWQFYILH